MPLKTMYKRTHTHTMQVFQFISNAICWWNFAFGNINYSMTKVKEEQMAKRKETRPCDLFTCQTSARLYPWKCPVSGIVELHWLPKQKLTLPNKSSLLLSAPFTSSVCDSILSGLSVIPDYMLVLIFHWHYYFYDLCRMAQVEVSKKRRITMLDKISYCTKANRIFSSTWLW